MIYYRCWKGAEGGVAESSFNVLEVKQWVNLPLPFRRPRWTGNGCDSTLPWTSFLTAYGCPTVVQVFVSFVNRIIS